MTTPWFEGKRNGVNRWFDGKAASGGLTITASPSRLKISGRTRLTVHSKDVRNLGKTCTLIVADDTVAEPVAYERPMEMDPAGGVSALFEIVASLSGSTTIEATVPDEAVEVLGDDYLTFLLPLI